MNYNMKPSVTMNSSSVTKMCNNLRAQQQDTIDAGTQALNNVAELAHLIAQDETPVMSGALKSSGKITEADTPTRLKRIISYGDSTENPDGVPTRKYAVTRHETPGPHYKWLENTVRDVGREILLDEIAKIMRQRLGR